MAIQLKVFIKIFINMGINIESILMTVKDEIVTALEHIENPFDEDECVANLKQMKHIVIRDAKHITESGYAYHVSVSVPNTDVWKERLEKSLGISYTGCSTSLNVIDNGKKLEFGMPVAKSTVAEQIRNRLDDMGFDEIPENVWNDVLADEQYETTSKEIARQFAAADINAAMKLDVC